MNPFIAAVDELASRRIILFGGKGGVGKTTLSTAAALHLRETRDVIHLRVETLDAEALYKRFLDENLSAFLEIGDRGTYLDREELQRLLEMSLPGIDELMSWMHIGELAESHPESLLVVDTAPTGHTLRMLSSSEHFTRLARALDAMQEKHRAMVRQFTRRDVRDAMDAFIEDFAARADRWRALLSAAAFVPVTLSEPLVVTQTIRLIEEAALDVPFVVLNRARGEHVDVGGYRVVEAPRSCVPLDSEDAIKIWSAATPVAALSTVPVAPQPVKAAIRIAALQMLAGKGGVGKTSCAASIALQLAQNNPTKRYVVISVDPAHSLRDVFVHQAPPKNLTVETIDTKAKWATFRDSVGREIERAVDALTPGNFSVSHDTEAMRQLIEIAPPGADEIFAISRLAELSADESLAGVIVDTAPTGHFLRLLDLPRTAGEWVRELMRLLLRYKDLVPPGQLGEELVQASRSFKELEATLHSERTAVIVVTRPERAVVAETKRLIDNLRERGIRVGGVIANYVTPANDDACDQSMRAHELALLREIEPSLVIERRDRPPTSLEELASLVETQA
jgi:arsenite-transporting ATPase